MFNEKSDTKNAHVSDIQRMFQPNVNEIVRNASSHMDLIHFLLGNLNIRGIPSHTRKSKMQFGSPHYEI